MIVMRDGFNYCRSCIYDLWEREGLEAAKHKADLAFCNNSLIPSI